MPARGVPHRDDPIKVEPVRLGDNAQVVGAAADVRKGARPAAAVVTDPTVLERPRCDATARQSRCQLCAMCNVELRLPATAVDENGNRVRTFPSWQSQVDELQRIAAVMNTSVRRRVLESGEIL